MNFICVNSQLPKANFQGNPNTQLPILGVELGVAVLPWQLGVGSALEVGRWKLGVVERGSA
jgi:hypothetical protein